MRVTVTLPGAPDRSIVTDPAVGEALCVLLDDDRMFKRWSGVSPDVRQAHQDILAGFLKTGAPPDVDHFRPSVFEDLKLRDLVHVRSGRIAVAYPFSVSPTDFRVTVGPTPLNAVCAIDALGVAAMAGRRVRVRCRCPVCKIVTDLEVASDGLTISQTTAPHARVWAGVEDVDGCAVDTQCRTMQLFCSPEHLAQWREAQSPGARGFDLSLEQGVQLGAAIFKPFLEAGRNEPET